MRNRIVMGTLLVLCCAVAGQAQAADKSHRHCTTGTIVAVDEAAKTFVVHPKTGADETFSWKDWEDAACWLNRKKVPCVDLRPQIGDVVTICQNGRLTIKVTRSAAAAPKTGPPKTGS